MAHPKTAGGIAAPAMEPIRRFAFQSAVTPFCIFFSASALSSGLPSWSCWRHARWCAPNASRRCNRVVCGSARAHPRAAAASAVMIRTADVGSERGTPVNCVTRPT